MKKCVMFLFALIITNGLLLGQEGKDSTKTQYVYPPSAYDQLSAEESWEIHKMAYLRKLKKQGLSDRDIQDSLVVYQKQKEDYIVQVQENVKLAAVAREKAAKRRKLAAIERAKATEQRKLADIQRKKADQLRKLADLERRKADEQRVQDEKLRERADALRRQADVERAKADELRKLAEVQRFKAEEQRKKSQSWRVNAKRLLKKRITFSKKSNIEEPISFQVSPNSTLRIGIRANISSGSTLIEVYNPKGIKEGELSLDFEASTSSKRGKDALDYTSGTLDKTIINAEAGKWQIKITSQKADGTVALSVAQNKKAPLDE